MVILTSMRAERATTNPYVIELNRRLADRTRLLRFSWWNLLFGRWDVFHVHWPEALARRPGRLRTGIASGLVVVAMARARLTSRPVVRTLHNIAPHERTAVAVRLALRAVDGATTGWILLTARTPVPGPGVVATIPHGTYTQWFASRPHPARVPGRLLFAGLVRPYKGVEDLLRAFAEVTDPGASLHVCGRPEDIAFGAAVAATVAESPRAKAVLRHLTDDEMSTEIGEAQVVVLPYRELHNSGMALLALSLGRPVLLPDNEVARDLAQEVGPEWVQTFSGDLGGAALVAALERTGGLTGEPDLRARSWETIAGEHVELFRAVLRGVRSKT